MANLYLFDVTISGNSIPVYKSTHTNVSRTQDIYVRDIFIDDKRYKAILKHAIKNGLSSFRNKGRVAISFSDSWKLYSSVLVELLDDKLIIVTVFTSKKFRFWTFFIKVPNRINLWKIYTMPRMSREELAAKKVDSRELHINLSSKIEDKSFLAYTNASSIKHL